MDKLSITLKRLLAEAHISEAELARRTGIAQPMINRLVRGKNTNPKLGTLQPIIKYFNITFSQLLGEQPLPNQLSAEFGDNDLFGVIAEVSHRNHWKEVPLLDWEKAAQVFAIDGKLSDAAVELILLDLPVNVGSFALRVNDDNLEPRFPLGSILVIDPNVSINQAELGLIYDENKGLHLSQFTPNTAQHNLQHMLGVLVQVRYNFI